jgi:steroid delta-isomerase-like uncharacterized protein
MAREFIDEVFNKGNMDVVEKYMAENMIDHNPRPNQEPGMQGFIKSVTEMREAMPDMKTEIVHLFADGDLVVIHNRVTATNTGSMMGMPPTGKRVDIGGADIVRFDNGKMVEHWGYYEQQKMMQQLGLMPEKG